ncbi:hypothetical protein GCM10027036_01550 [Flavihumibacter cheonanensis]|jgi:SAM-dependent methyltransferase|uniref:methyltransferase domain-containing protein n=1 Tax=Flavihumibacter cheonanensis TaxID=1442385 RepID=UPI001EF8A146|nr:class I SAM-dependent methyltransferase [Flavihumibacter cheonanensis]MCG7752397.1 class I SAM-dependent methyltransferase [Flavihumibacter cheonanensis]
MWFKDDPAFHTLYPVELSQMARRHWTPLLVARKAARFLVTQPGDRILDIGSGAGKFCLAAARECPQGKFTGIEQRRNLVEYANQALEITGLTNAEFLHGNITDLNFKDFDHFYFYNSFYEYIVDSEKIDDQISFSSDLFNYYSHYLYKQLCKAPEGTRLVTYHSLETEIPPSFQLVATEINDQLKFWVKL